MQSMNAQKSKPEGDNNWWNRITKWFQGEF